MYPGIIRDEIRVERQNMAEEKWVSGVEGIKKSEKQTQINKMTHIKSILK
jgi:hypothetical protein